MHENGLNLVFPPPIEARQKRTPENSRGAVRRVVGGGWVAVSACMLILGLLYFPLGHAGSLDLALLHEINIAMSRLPLIGLQAAVLNEDIPQLIIGVAAVALWFGRPISRSSRDRIILAFVAFFPVYALARIGQHFDHRERPMMEQTLQPLGDPALLQSIKAAMSHWGSFPSDHAALLAIATVVAFTVSRRIGLIALGLAAYSCLFRIAYGYHWPSDIAGGAVLGTVVVILLLGCERKLRPLLDRVFTFIEHRPGLSAAIGSVILIEFSDGFHYSLFFVSMLLHARLFH